jgi:hypothetical protein
MGSDPVRFALQVSGRLAESLRERGLAVQDAANAAVVRQTSETLGEMRVQVASRLSVRASNALRQRRFTNPSTVGQGDVVGFINSAWFRQSRSGGGRIDLFRSFETGMTIYPTAGKRTLAIPLPQAYAVVGGQAKGAPGRGRKRPTVASVKQALGPEAKLFVLERPGRTPLLAASGVAVSQSTRGRGKIKARGYTTRKGTRRYRKAYQGEPIPLFALLRNSRLPKKLDFERTRQREGVALGEKFIQELARRRV